MARLPLIGLPHTPLKEHRHGGTSSPKDVKKLSVPRHLKHRISRRKGKPSLERRRSRRA